MIDRLFSDSHEWLTIDNDVVTIGISPHAVNELGEIVYIQLEAVGTELHQGDEFGTIESVKTVSGLYMPLNGTVYEQNDAILRTPELVNQSPFDDGWFIKIKIQPNTGIDHLMDESAYLTFSRTTS